MTKPKRKIVVMTVFAVVLAIFLVHLVSALTLDRSMQYVETSFSSPKIGPELDGYVVAFVSDTHEISAEALQNIVARINEHKVDLLLLGGDYARGEGYRQTMEILGKTQARDGIFGVDGNHDKSWLVFAAMLDNGIRPLSNVGLELFPGLSLAGVSDLWSESPEVTKAVSGAAPKDFVLLVSHNPDVSMQQDTTAVDIMLSGHTHGGIMTLFGVWTPSLYLISGYGHKFMGGWAEAPYDTAVYVGKGVGCHKLGATPFYLPRVFARPQVIFLTLYNKAQ